MTPYGDIEKPSIGSGNGSLPDSTRPLTETKLIRTKWQSSQCIYQGKNESSHKNIFNALRPKQNGPYSPDDISNAFSWMKIIEFRLRFHWSLFLRFQFATVQHWFRKWLGADQATSHYLNPWLPLYWRIYASPGLNELNKPCVMWHMFTLMWQRLYIWHKEAWGK